MDRLLFTLVLIVVAWIISFVTGRNRRQIDKIPEGMGILCQPPGKRYMLYALGVMVFVVVLFFHILYLMDGAPQNGRGMWGLVALGVFFLGFMIFCGNMLARDCVYFNYEEIQIEKAFRKPRVVRWEEIRKIDGDFDNNIRLYLMDGTKILAADLGMVNYELFCKALKKSCPAVVAEYYRSQRYEHPQKCILRYGLEYYVLAIMGILILLLYLVMLVRLGDKEWLRRMLQSDDPSQLFSIWFAPVCGVISLIALFIMCNTRIRYDQEKMTMRFPLRGKKELYWSNIQSIEVVTEKKPEGISWKKLKINTDTGKYRINLRYLNHGKDGFITELLKMVERYEIPFK